MQTIDYRSDTVTHPTPAMFEAMRKAPLGDDVYGEDPTVNELQRKSAEMLGKETAIFVPSGTMGNLAAVLAHCGRGDEVIMGTKAHTFLFEAGGIAALGGIHPHTLPNQLDGTLALVDIENAIRSVDIHYPPSRLLILENTQNACGGYAISAEYTQSAADLVHKHGLKLHIDGARIFNAAVKLGVDVKALTAPADSVTFCLSKSLCCPVGAIIAGEAAFIERTRHMRKMLGGGMRQAGVLAAAGLVALDSMIERLAEDHARAVALAEGLATIPTINLYPGTPETNMVYFRLAEDAPMQTEALVKSFAAEGIRIGGHGDEFRLVTHYWIDDAAVEKTINLFKRCLS
jgi:threonine aldolase